MPVSLSTALADAPNRAERHRRKSLSLPADPFALGGTELVRTAWVAVGKLVRTAGLSKSEHEALVQATVERALIRRSARRGTAREVIAWIDRAERMPLTAARESARLTRGAEGHKELAGIARELLRDSREWRDLAASYRVRTRKDRLGDGERLQARVIALESTGEGLLAQASVAAMEDPMLTPLREDARELALAATERVEAPEGMALSESARWKLRVSLARALGGELGALARSEGVSEKAIYNGVARGKELWRSLYPNPAALVAHLHASAEAAGLLEPVEEDATRPVLNPAELAARNLLDRLSPTTTYRALARQEVAARTSDGTIRESASRTDSSAAVLAHIDSLDALASARVAMAARGERAERRGLIRVAGGVGLAGSAAEQAEAQRLAALSCWAQMRREDARRTVPRRAQSVLHYIGQVEQSA